jgi:hypothetical protein
MNIEIHDYTNPTDAQLIDGKTEDEARAALEAKYGAVYDTRQMQEHFTAHFFAAPAIGVTRKSDGVRGLLTFTHRPRFYYNFVKEPK